MQIIPAIDLLGGQCVRLHKGDFEQVTTYAQDPQTLADRYRTAGMERLHVVDLDGARTGEPVNAETIHKLACSSGVEVQAGGGIRDHSRLEQLLNAGARRAVLGSVAVEKPEQVAEWISEFGADSLILAFDVAVGGTDPSILTHGWKRDSGISLWELTEYYLDLGAQEFLCTDVSRDGTLEGPSTNLYALCGQRYPDGRFIASGGVSGAGDLTALRETGVFAAVTGKALLDGRLTVEEIRAFLRDE